MSYKPRFDKGDKVIRTVRTFGQCVEGQVYEVGFASDYHLTIPGHLNTLGEPVRYDPSFFRMARKEEVAAGHAIEPKALPPAPELPGAFFKAGQSDPTGKDQHAPGAKLDAGKPRHGLVLGGFSNALTAVAEVGTFGANKYTDNGWKSVPNGEARYTDALLRHHFAEAGGELHDSESKLTHAAHRAWNALAVLELMLTKEKK